MQLSWALVQFVHGSTLLHLILRRRQLTQEKWFVMGTADVAGAGSAAGSDSEPRASDGAGNDAVETVVT
jgi:hypothetical protein